VQLGKGQIRTPVTNRGDNSLQIYIDILYLEEMYHIKLDVFNEFTAH